MPFAFLFQVSLAFARILYEPVPFVFNTHLVAELLYLTLQASCLLQIHEHILIYGDIRVKTKVKLGPEEVEIEEFVSDEQEEGAVKHSISGLLARRPSFMLMSHNMKAQVSGAVSTSKPIFRACGGHPWTRAMLGKLSFTQSELVGICMQDTNPRYGAYPRLCMQ